jgi:hypothetical protein
VRAAVAIATLAAAAALNVRASEGLLYAGLYYCNAETVNKMVVRVCSARHPLLALRSERAFATWMSRFGEKAIAAAKKCDTEFGKPAGVEDLEAFRSNFAKVRDKWLSDIETNLTAETANSCEAAVSGLENGSKLEDGLWRQNP